MIYALLVATILLTLAELGDKTQLLALVLATRYKPGQVMLGIFGATLIIHFLSTIVGAAVGSFIPQAVLTWGSGLLFVGFGIWRAVVERNPGVRWAIVIGLVAGVGALAYLAGPTWLQYWWR